MRTMLIDLHTEKIEGERLKLCTRENCDMCLSISPAYGQLSIFNHPVRPGSRRTGRLRTLGQLVSGLYICYSKLTKMLSGSPVHNLNSLINLATLGNLWIALNAHSYSIRRFNMYPTRLR